MPRNRRSQECCGSCGAKLPEKNVILRNAFRAVRKHVAYDGVKEITILGQLERVKSTVDKALKRYEQLGGRRS